MVELTTHSSRGSPMAQTPASTAVPPSTITDEEVDAVMRGLEALRVEDQEIIDAMQNWEMMDRHLTELHEEAEAAWLAAHQLAFDF